MPELAGTLSPLARSRCRDYTCNKLGTPATRGPEAARKPPQHPMALARACGTSRKCRTRLFGAVLVSKSRCVSALASCSWLSAGVGHRASCGEGRNVEFLRYMPCVCAFKSRNFAIGGAKRLRQLRLPASAQQTSMANIQACSVCLLAFDAAVCVHVRTLLSRACAFEC